MIRVEACVPWCGRRGLARIGRKPRGLPEGMRWDGHASFCCNPEGCGRRATTSSVRFRGRTFCTGFDVMLLATMRRLYPMDCATENLTPEIRHQIRQQKARSVLETIQEGAQALQLIR